jgi:molybdenum cofactor cytidylyltransferase
METRVRNELKPPLVNGLLVAAGFSSRMVDFKPLLLWKGEPFVVHILRKMKAVCRRIVVVTGHREAELTEEIKKSDVYSDQIQFVTNPQFEQGMFTSLQAGLRELNDSDWVLYHFVDQPDIPDELYFNLTAQIPAEYDWIQPCYGARRGHPILLGSALFDAIIRSDASCNLRSVLQEHPARRTYFDCSFPQILHDLDYPEDLRRLTNEP